MASMNDPQDRKRILERLNDTLATVENSFTLELQLEAVDEAWTTLRAVVRQELEDAEAALVAAA